MTETTISTPSANGAVTLPPSNGSPSYQKNTRGTNRDSGDAFGAGFALKTLRKWWKLIVPLGLVLAAIIGTALYFTFEPTYEASAWLRIKESTPFVVAQSREYSQSFAETQIQLILSPLVLGAAIAQPEVADIFGDNTEEAGIRWLTKELEVEAMGDSELVKVALETTSPDEATRIVNAVANAYMSLLDQNNASDTRKVIDTLEKERNARSQEVARWRQEIHDLAEQTGEASGGSAEGVSTADGLATELQTRLADTELEREVLNTQITALEQSIAAGRVEVPDAELDVAVDEQAEVEQFQDLLSEKLLNLHEIAAKSAAGEQDPFYQQLSKEIRSDQQTLERLRAELRTKLKPRIEKKLLNESRTQLDGLRTELAKHDLTIRTLGQRIENYLDKARQLSGKALELEHGRAELALAEEKLDLVTSRLVELRAESDAPARITLLRSATVPTTPVETASWKKIIFASLLGLIAPFGLAFVWERSLRRVGDREELERLCNLSVLAEVPQLPESVSASADSSDEHVQHSLAMFEESIDGLRTCLMLPEPLQHMHTLAVTSAVSGEGKTTIAGQLAISIARATGEDTLLIDGDVRTPSIQRLFELPLEPGLSEVLGGRCAIADAIKASRYEGLHVLPAGRLSASPHGVFRRQSLLSLFEELRDSFRYLVIDTPPVLGASEALSLAKTADACVVCARWDVSRTDRVQAACERLLSADVRPVGIVLNGVPFKHYAYRYGRYGYSYG